MTNESLATTRRAAVTAMGVLALNTLAPLTAFANRRQRRCCSPSNSCSVRPYGSGFGFSSPPSDLIIDSPSGQTISVGFTVQAFPGGTNWRVILAMHPTAFDQTNAPTTDTLPAYWTIVPVAQGGGTYTANVTGAAGLPQGNTITTLGSFQLSVIGQLYFMSAWNNYYSSPVALHGHTPTPTP